MQKSILEKQTQNTVLSSKNVGDQMLQAQNVSETGKSFPQKKFKQNEIIYNEVFVKPLQSQYHEEQKKSLQDLSVVKN